LVVNGDLTADLWRLGKAQLTCPNKINLDTVRSRQRETLVPNNLGKVN